MIAPSDLRLVPSTLSATGFMLYCVVREQRTGTEVLERIHQLGLELHQHELRSLSPSMLREIAKCCFNDLRTIFLVHDKRMLGLVLEELDALLNVQQVLTSSQAEILRCGITPTIIPGSREMMALIHTAYDNQGVKDNLLLKPIRGGKGAGIVFGSDMTPQAWASHLALLRRPDVVPGNVAYVVQREIKQPRYSILLHESEGLQHNQLVGTFMSIHGQYLGLGLWRTSPDRICALSRGGAWICSVTSIKRPDIEKVDQIEEVAGLVRAKAGGRAGTGVGVGVDVKDREKMRLRLRLRLAWHSHSKVWLFVVILIAARVYYQLLTL